MVLAEECRDTGGRTRTEKGGITGHVRKPPAVTDQVKGTGGCGDQVCVVSEDLS